MSYEVVDPSSRDERGTMHRTFTEAMVAASPAHEVWQLADDDALTRMVMCWPDPEYQPAIDAGFTERLVHQHIGRAEREATAILADHNPVSPQSVHALVSLAWGRGFVAGFGAGSDRFAELLTRLSEAARR